jgi:hypothetical protein
MRYYRKLELALALVAALGLSSFASAQEFRSDRAQSEGPGFKAGRLVLHPGLSLEGGYDSNVFLQKNNVEDSFILRLTGYLDVATEPPQRQSGGESNKPETQKIEFRGGVGVSYYQYFNGRVAPNAAADAHIDFGYNPSAVFSLQVRDIFTRTIRPFTNANVPTGTATSYGRNRNTASLDLVGRSKSKVLEGRLGYTNAIEFFDAAEFQYGNNMTHRVPASLSWSFFPSSALVWDAEYINQQFDQDQVATATTLLSDNNRIRTTVGYNGALTERFSMTAAVGYTAGFYTLASDFDGAIARVDARWRPRPTISFMAGYEHDYRPSFIGNFTRLHRLFVDTRFTLSGALLLGIKGWVSFDKSGLALNPDGSLLDPENPNREDIRVFVGIFGEYRFKAWLAMFAQVGYLADFTDFEYFGTDPLLDPAAGYQRFDAWLGLRVFY